MLHGADVLESLADDGSPLVRDWARTRLAVVAPERLRGRLPEDGWGATLCGLRTPVIDALLPHVRAGRAWAAEAVVRLGTLGAWPEDLGPVVDAARAGLAAAPADCASILIAAGVADAAVLRAVADVDRAAAGAVALLLAVRAGILDETALAVATSLDAEGISLVLEHLGVRRFDGIGAMFGELEAVAGYGAIVAGGDEDLRVPRGAGRRRPGAWIRHLLDGVSGPAAALLRATPQPVPDHVAVAAWLARSAPSGDPVRDVLERGRDSSRELAAAVRAVTPAAADGIRETPPQAHGPRVLALAVARAAPEHRSALVGWILDELDYVSIAHPGARVVGAAAAALEPSRVAGLLADPEARLVGMAVARYVLDEAALAVLLGLPVSAEPDERADHAAALAGSGDPAAAAPLRDLYAFDPELPAEPRELYEALLGAPLDTI